MKNSQVKKLAKLIKPGTIWQIDDHRLAYGDCRDPNLIAKLLNGEKIDRKSVV